MKQRYIRPDCELTDDTIVVVRGGELMREILERDARRAHEIYGTYAISVFAADGVTVDELAQEPPLVRFASITLMTVGAIRAAGLRLSPSGRNRCTTASTSTTFRPGFPRSSLVSTARSSTRIMKREMSEKASNGAAIDLVADLNAQDDDGNGWGLLRDAREPARVQVGRMLLAGNLQATAVVRVTAVDDDGQVHFVILPGPVSKNRHLLDRASA